MKAAGIRRSATTSAGCRASRQRAASSRCSAPPQKVENAHDRL
eukprot:CAMPEP_0179905760 /NCGR_PEP_ID=MMETSP0982-20121206/42809_1 /TAXON_ID=483367 /ORGANISM="non described non described, Strain CCMP 2436" /LENGTH=42 /DNA_ID= /DNA_START= /DNA_END= /DNA_ORIENTATION=